MSLSLTQEQLESLYAAQKLIADILKDHADDVKKLDQKWHPLTCSDCHGTCYNICNGNCEGACKTTCEGMDRL
jgi:hypothetical protein